MMDTGVKAAQTAATIAVAAFEVANNGKKIAEFVKKK